MSVMLTIYSPGVSVQRVIHDAQEPAQTSRMLHSHFASPDRGRQVVSHKRNILHMVLDCCFTQGTRRCECKRSTSEDEGEAAEGEEDHGSNSRAGISEKPGTFRAVTWIKKVPIKGDFWKTKWLDKLKTQINMTLTMTALSVSLHCSSIQCIRMSPAPARESSLCSGHNSPPAVAFHCRCQAN